MVRKSTGIDVNDWKGLLVLCAANRFDGIKLADQHMAEHLARWVPVLYVDPPVSLLSAQRNPEVAASLEGPRLRVIGPGLARFTPVVQPFPSRRGMTWLTSILARQLICRATCRLGGDVQAIVSAWPLFNVFGSCDERVRVYWAQDDFVGGATLLGFDPHTVRVREKQTAAAANFIVAANPSVAETWHGRGFAPMLIPFGVDVQAYEDIDVLAPAPDVDLPAPIAGFVGHINDRTDIALLEAVAAQGRSLLLVGPRNPAFEPTRWNALTKRPNVRWVGPKKFNDLPLYLRAIDVGLVPYGDSAFNRGSFPLKTLEYLAAGRPVVATGLPATRWLATDLITIANEPAAFAEAVSYWLDKPRIKVAVDARREFARRHSWARRAKEIAKLVHANYPTALCDPFD